jgi:DNA mismatch endonuclease (patch repair protein)
LDKFDEQKRSEIMSKIRSKDTTPEKLVRHLLFAQGFRYRLNVRKMPGVPDLVFPKYRAVIFVHGCFWHAHEGCSRATVPSTNEEFWRSKLARNRARDEEVRTTLMADGWRVLTIWECACGKRTASLLARLAADFLRDPARTSGEIDGRLLQQEREKTEHDIEKH